MMCRIIILMFCAVAAIASLAQVNVRGTVIDRDTNEPLVGASVIVKGADGKIKKFASSKADGGFAMQLPSIKGCRLEVAMMSFAKQSIPLDSVSFPLTVYMEKGATLLKEVTVKADRIREQGDTITYNVGSFAQSQDRSIGDVLKRMPGSTGGIVVPTFKHGLTNTIPGLLAAWKRWGFIEGIHYVVGRKPPKSFRQPIIDPKDYEHVISFYNGSCAVIISQDRPGSSNSLTLSWLLVDEAKFIDYQKLKDETLPANGGIKSHFGRHSFNHSIMILSDMPQTQKGSWFLHYRDKMDPELIKTIEATVYEIWRTKERIRALNASGKPVPPYLKGYLRRLDRDLNKMRSVAVYYREYSSIENLQLLGENYIKQMKRDLTPLTFQTSILCQRIGIAKDGFYSSMREGHKYDANDNQYLDTLGYDYDFSTLDARADKDVDPDAPICIGMDYNANINWIVAGQPRDRRLNVIKSFYVKFDRKIPALVEDFCRYYAAHRNKTVVYYYDATALGSNYAVNDQDFHYNVVKEFERHGWRIESVYLGNPMHHDEKYLLINNAFAEKQRLMPFFNRSNNEDLILAIQSAGVSNGRNGFRKDKSGEKLAESEEDLLEHRTDGTDAFDTLYIGCEKFPYRDAFSLTMSGVL